MINAEHKSSRTVGEKYIIVREECTKAENAARVTTPSLESNPRMASMSEGSDAQLGREEKNWVILLDPNILWWRMKGIVWEDM